MRRIPRCPKCRGLPNEYREMWADHSLSFDADEKGKPSDEGYTHEGSPKYVIASCGKCSWAWRVKGVIQITEIKEMFEE